MKYFDHIKVRSNECMVSGRRGGVQSRRCWQKNINDKLNMKLVKVRELARDREL
uniref:Uncharacterized protein n=1 Tax=Arion vulgaris TaxID=1028688 RepID=A0A0B6ZV67_9EUPU